MHKDIKQLAEQAWHGELDIMFEHHPVHAFYEGATELAQDLLSLKGLAAIYIIDTGDGLVMLDAGTQLDIDRTYEAVRQWRPNTPLVAAVFSHHHVDHVFATRRFDEEAKNQGWPAPQVYAHELLPDHFDRYIKTRDWNTAINRRQFAIDVPHFQWPDQYRYPDVTYQNRLTFQRGVLTFELHHARGETDDHTWTWIPERRILMPGDLFIWATPNAGNPQKVQRYASDWADALEEMLALEPEIMLPGHGFPIFGAERIAEALSNTARVLRSIEDQTLALMNQGRSLDHIMHAVELPEDLLEKPYLKPVYDHPQFLIRMIWRRYGGWWDGDFDTLLPAPRADQAREWVSLAGGINKVLQRAQQLSDKGEHALACHLAETARHAVPDSKAVHTTRSQVFSANSKAQSASMARNILNHAALASQQGKRDLAEKPDA